MSRLNAKFYTKSLQSRRLDHRQENVFEFYLPILTNVSPRRCF